MSGIGFGGNAIFETGQLTMTGTPVPVPVPTFGQGIVPGQVLLHLRAGAVDVFIVNSAAGTIATGYRLLANTSEAFYFRQQPYIVGASGTVTYLWEGS